MVSRPSMPWASRSTTAGSTSVVAPGTRKYRNVDAGNRRVALIIDDLASVQPWAPRGIKIHGSAEIVERDGMFGPGQYLAITPVVSWSWGIVGTTFEEGRFKPHKIVWTAP
jgi:PPOX class F420-dependent enzyme/OxyR family protein